MFPALSRGPVWCFLATFCPWVSSAPTRGGSGRNRIKKNPVAITTALCLLLLLLHRPSAAVHHPASPSPRPQTEQLPVWSRHAEVPWFSSVCLLWITGLLWLPPSRPPDGPGRTGPIEAEPLWPTNRSQTVWSGLWSCWRRTTSAPLKLHRERTEVQTQQTGVQSCSSGWTHTAIRPRWGNKSTKTVFSSKAKDTRTPQSFHRSSELWFSLPQTSSSLPPSWSRASETEQSNKQNLEPGQIPPLHVNTVSNRWSWSQSFQVLHRTPTPPPPPSSWKQQEDRKRRVDHTQSPRLWSSRTCVCFRHSRMSAELQLLLLPLTLLALQGEWVGWCCHGDATLFVPAGVSWCLMDLNWVWFLINELIGCCVCLFVCLKTTWGWRHISKCQMY